MPYLNEVLRAHRCTGLPKASISAKKHDKGTTWQCGSCGAVYTLRYSTEEGHRDPSSKGWYWEETIKGNL